MTAVLLATRNQHKLVELRRIVLGLLEVEVVGLDDVAPYPEVQETGATFVDNALLKARAGALCTGLVTVADDSGLIVDELGGMPGVLSARWAGHERDDMANTVLVLDQLLDVPDERRTGSFVCAAAAVTPDGRERVVEGRMPGRVIRQPRGSNGFGYDPIFVPVGYDLTTAELTAQDKDAISHRGQALRALVEPLRALLA